MSASRKEAEVKSAQAAALIYSAPPHIVGNATKAVKATQTKTLAEEHVNVNDANVGVKLTIYLTEIKLTRLSMQFNLPAVHYKYKYTQN